MNEITRRGTLGAGVALLAPAIVRAQEKFPSRTMTWVVPFPAGGTTDLLARIFAQKLTEAFGQSVVVENVGGGGGSIGADKVAKAAPDGYTLLLHNVTFSTTTSSLIATGRARHTFDDFMPVSLAANVPLIVMCHPSVPAKDLKEFVAFAKEQNAADKGVFYGTTGPGSVMHLSAETLKRDTGIKMDHVPFRGAAPLVQELLTGRIQLGGDQISTSLAHVRGGALRCLATLSPKRAEPLPDVATVREQGFPNMELFGWNGFFAPAKTPPAAVAAIQAEMAKAARDPDVRRRLGEVGAEAMGSTQEELAKVLREQVAVVKPLVEELKLVVQ
ncbi:MAG: tripartite tricarboxylate transporter substrate binding protein [Xanthobacteraceae bacterium]